MVTDVRESGSRAADDFAVRPDSWEDRARNACNSILNSGPEQALQGVREHFTVKGDPTILTEVEGQQMITAIQRTSAPT